jgi:hypothetical protein
MRGEGFEPAKAMSQQILSLSRLATPASPHEHHECGDSGTAVPRMPTLGYCIGGVDTVLKGFGRTFQMTCFDINSFGNITLL